MARTYGTWTRVAQTVSRPYLRSMNGTKNDIDPATELVEEDDEQALPEQEPATSISRPDAGPLAAGRAVIARHAKHAPSSPGVYRMIDAQGRRALRRQGEEHQEAGHRLYAADRLRPPHRAHDRGDRGDGVRLDRDRDRGAAARSQPDQAAAAALQRAAARRQVVSLYPDHRATMGAADPQASRRAHRDGRLLRAVRLGLGGQPHHQRAAARVPAALLLGCVLREPHAAVPAVPDQALLGALHGRDRFRRTTANWCARPTRSCRARARR